MRCMICLYRLVWTIQLDKAIRTQFACAPVYLQPRSFQSIMMIEDEAQNPVEVVSMFSNRSCRRGRRESVWASIIIGEMEGEQRLIGLEWDLMKRKTSIICLIDYGVYITSGLESFEEFYPWIAFFVLSSISLRQWGLRQTMWDAPKNDWCNKWITLQLKKCLVRLHFLFTARNHLDDRCLW